MNRGKQVHHQLFSRIILSAIFLLLSFLSGENNLHAQTRVTGHVFAEIVEPTALSARASNSHSVSLKDNTSGNELVLAEVMLRTSQNLNIDVSVTTSNLKASNGQILPFTAIACPGCQGENLQALTGEKLYTLKATTGGTPPAQNNITYSGRYQVVFMYN